MICTWYFSINTTLDILKLSQISALEITYNNFEILLEVFMLNITTDHAITYTNMLWRYQICIAKCLYSYGDDLPIKNLFKITAEEWKNVYFRFTFVAQKRRC